MRRGEAIGALMMSNYSVAKRVLDSLVLSLMKGIRPEYIRIAIDNNVHLYEYMASDANRIVSEMKRRMDGDSFRNAAKVIVATLGLVRYIVSQFREARERFVPERVFSWLKEKRPDLAEAIESHPNGMKWFEEEVWGLRRLFIGDSGAGR